MLTISKAIILQIAMTHNININIYLRNDTFGRFYIEIRKISIK